MKLTIKGLKTETKRNRNEDGNTTTDYTDVNTIEELAFEFASDEIKDVMDAVKSVAFWGKDKKQVTNRR